MLRLFKEPNCFDMIEECQIGNTNIQLIDRAIESLSRRGRRWVFPNAGGIWREGEKKAGIVTESANRSPISKICGDLKVVISLAHRSCKLDLIEAVDRGNKIVNPHHPQVGRSTPIHKPIM